MAEKPGAIQSQIVSKQRVADHGEVYTRPEEVNAMIDLVWNKIDPVEARFLEPACGSGNFLDTILRRKLEKVKAIPKKRQEDFEKRAMVAVASLYGIELLEDNVTACRSRLYETFVDVYAWRYARTRDDDYLKSIRYILDRNIVHGDALTLLRVDGSEDPIVFSEWSFASGGQVNRRDYQFEHLIPEQPKRTSQPPGQLGLGFSNTSAVRNEDNKDVFIPRTVADYAPVFYREVHRAY